MSPAEIEAAVNSGRNITVEPAQPAAEPQLVISPQETASYTTTAKGTQKYWGDYSEEEGIPVNGYKCLSFETPGHVLIAFNDDIVNGTVNLHQWQIDVNGELACLDKKPTSQNPLKWYLCASNGSGKDAFVIAPFAIWFILCKIRSRVIITSASGTQLTAQTEGYIRSLAERVNQKLGYQMFKIRQRYIYCIESGSEIRMFATDEAGKAEGYHPLEPNAEMAIIKNESKSIEEDIHKALKRCSGFNYWLEVSSPGAPVGAFYYAATNWKNGHHVTSYDCPHISRDEIESDKIELGENSPEFRSKHLALFTSIDSEVVMPVAIIENLLTFPPQFNFISWPKRVGIDIAAGGDETVVVITQGCKILKEYAFIEKDTTKTVARIARFLADNGITKEHETIYADDGGIGHAVIDSLNNAPYDYRVKRVLNQSAAYNRKRYGNRGAEMWFNVKRIFEEALFDIRGISQKCKDQLCNRKYKQQEGGRLFLQSKRAAKSEGFNSPDRADALILSLCGLTIEDFLGEGKTKTADEPKRRKLNTAQEVNEYYDGITFKEYEMLQEAGRRNKRANGSLQSALGLINNDTDNKYGI